MKAVALVALLLAVAGCASPGPTGGPGAREDRTGGLALRLRSRSEDGAVKLFVVDADGTLGFGGGFDALIEKTPWTGTLTDEEIATMLDLVAALEPDGATPIPTPSDAPSTITRDLRIRRADGRFDVLDTHDDPSMVALESFLDAIRRRRYEPILDSLPKAGAPRR